MSLEIRPVKPDRSRVELTDEFALRHWIKNLGVSREEIAAAIAKVGDTAKAVRKELAREQARREEAKAQARE
jgi:hypothetical protein